MRIAMAVVAECWPAAEPTKVFTKAHNDYLQLATGHDTRPVHRVRFQPDGCAHDSV